MRRFAIIVMAGIMALAVAAPVSAGANVYNSSSSALTAQGSWYTEGADGYTFGYVAAWKQGSSSPFMELYTETGNWVDCTPGDPTDDFYGFVGSFQFGYGDATLTIGRTYGSANATATFDVYGADVDQCADTWIETSTPGVQVSLALTATGPKVMQRGTWSFKIPSQFNSHSSYSSTYRMASGTATIDGASMSVDGGIGKVTWRDHYNG